MVPLGAAPAWSGEIVLPSNALERDARIRALYRTDSSGTGKGSLSVRWTDVHGRLVEQRKIPFELKGAAEVAFDLDLRRAVGMLNTLTVRFSFAGIDKSGATDRRDEEATLPFIARPRHRTWWDYQIIMWQARRAEQ